MGEPTTPGQVGIADDPQGRDPNELAAKRDRLLARIESERLIESWCWTHLYATLGHLADHGDRLLWVQVAYLSSVCVTGTAMFRSAAAEQPHLAVDGTEVERYPPVRCPCGTDVPGVRPQRRNRRDVVLVSCPDCRRDVAAFDGVGYAGPTLISSQV